MTIRYPHTIVFDSVGSNIGAVAKGNNNMQDIFIVKKYDSDHSPACFPENRIRFIISYMIYLIARKIIKTSAIATNSVILPLSSAGIDSCRWANVIIVAYSIVFVYRVKLPVLLMPVRLLYGVD